MIHEEIRWVYAFADRPRERFAQAAAFWTAVTGSTLSPLRGEHGEFATLLPGADVDAGADACWKLQGVDGPGGAHLDLAVQDPAALVAAACERGARVVADHGDAAQRDYTVLASPAGQLFCAVRWNGETRRPGVFAGTRLDQVSIDVAPDLYEAEAAFWGELTGWPVLTGSRPEFHVVRSPAELPIRLLIQRLDEPRATGAHLDFACADRDKARTEHEALSAGLVAEFPHWIVMRDPAGGVYCLTARDPETGMLA